MKAIKVELSGETPVLKPDLSVPEPMLGPGEMLIHIRAAGVTPTELLWYPTYHQKDGSPREGAIPGHEFSGVVAALGEGVDAFSVGEEVYGLNDWFEQGATAEACLTLPAYIATKPRRLSHEEAAAVPIGALTAWQGLHDRTQLKTGERVLIHGGSGAVGVFAIQLAKSIGAEVITTASKRNEAFLKDLGATLVIDYKEEDFTKVIDGPVDVIFDGVGGETLDRSWSLLKPGGRLATIAASSEETTEQRVKDAFFIVEPSHNQLARIAQQLDAGTLRVFVDAVVPFEDAPDAYAGKVKSRTGRGKVVVSMSA
ncbi:NADPH:quinone reductase-like Zn-dependent oxidoreductase [Roseimicrobium gellanilyticum]|uniref:NADPH:quinone reductase-like Zn-dependent oxidoreductase n=1 Tax=Roseimicrobium gellanilyticum TaxID=748857 RepID=A0A366HVW9_9BACT|nr:NADP-dependent oxidoreductase [Roseimicrobium gellanilyticum]RBP48227.1 NADPH:quinone reductase-like Zn-dependent oxidoreductase [Roseimicrobium gellanilyticum]